MEGGGESVSVRNFYWEVIQAVLLLGEETWVLLAAMSKNLEGVHVGLLIQVMGKTARR